MTINVVRLAVGGSSLVGLFSLFGGFYWWCFRARFVSSFTLSFQKYLSSDAAVFDVRIVNRGRRKIVVEAVSALPPFSILADDRGEPCTAEIIQGDQDELDHVQYSKVHLEIEPRFAAAWTIIISRSGHLQARESIPIKLHIRTSCPLFRQTKVLTAVLPQDPIS